MTSSQPPHSSSAARILSVRGARRVNQRPAARANSAAGQQPGDLRAEARSRTAAAGRWTRRSRCSPPPPPPLPVAAARVGPGRCSRWPAPQRVGRASPRCTAGIGGRPERHQRDVPAGGHHDAPRRREQVPDPVQSSYADRPPGRPRPKAGHDSSALHHLGQEARSRRDAGDSSQRDAASDAWWVDRPHHEVAAERQQQDQQRVRVVEPEHQRRNGCQRRPGRRRPGRPPAPDQRFTAA